MARVDIVSNDNNWSNERLPLLIALLAFFYLYITLLHFFRISLMSHLHLRQSSLLDQLDQTIEHIFALS